MVSLPAIIWKSYGPRADPLARLVGEATCFGVKFLVDLIAIEDGEVIRAKSPLLTAQLDLYLRAFGTLRDLGRAKMNGRIYAVFATAYPGHHNIEPGRIEQGA